MMASQPDPVALSRALVPHAEEYYDLLRYELDPLGTYRLCPNQRLSHVTVNKHGYRGAPLSGAEAVLLLGDSVTFGVGASSDAKTFARFLEEASEQRVADASVRGYRVFQHFIQLPRLLDLLPQVSRVVVWFGYADLLYWVTTGGCVQGAFQFEWKYRAQDPAPQSRWQRRLRAPISGLIRHWQGSSPRLFARETGALEDLASHVSSYLNGIRDLCASRGITTTFLVQPFVRTRPDREPIRTLADLYDAKTVEKCGQSWYVIAPQFIRHVRERLPRETVLFDCQELVTEDDFLDQVHVKEEALCRLAKQVVEGLLRPASCHTAMNEVASHGSAMHDR